MKAKRVYQYDENGVLVKSWKSISSVAGVYEVDESSIRKAARKEGKSVGYYWSFGKHGNFFDSDFADDALEAQNNSLEKSLIKARDAARIYKKDRRGIFRYLNVLESMGESIISQLEDVSFGDPIQTKLNPKVGKILIAQVSDTHFNELIDLPQNTYDFTVASQRLQKYAEKIKQQADGASKIVVALTGDMLNSDRRLDEKLSQATNRMKAALLATSLLSYFIQDLSTIAPIEVISVTGNESRIHDEFGLSDALLTDNYDYLIHNLIKPLFKNNSRVTILDGNPAETVLNINGLNVLFTHGTMYRQATQERIQKTFGRYSARGINLDFILFGHVHFANIGDIFARSGSLSGSNTYSEYGLDLVTKASQNLHIVHDNKDMDNMRIDLHYADDYDGYPIQDDIAAYNAIGSKKVYTNYNVIYIKN